MSKNFELLTRAKKTLERVDIVEPTLHPEYRHSRPYAETKSDSDRFDGMRALAVLRKRFVLSAFFAAAVFITVAVATLFMRSVYAPVATIQVDPPGTTFSLDPRGDGSDNIEYLETAAKNLQTGELLVDVIQKLHLDHNPEFYSPEKKSKDSYGPGSVNGVQLSPAMNGALRHLRQVLSVQRDPQSRLITVSVASHDPRVAADVTNTLVTDYIENTYRSEHNAVSESTSWVSKQLDDIRTRMEQSNNALMDFQKQTGIVDIDTNKSSVSEQIAEFNRQLAQAQSDKIQAESYLRQVKSGEADSLPQIEDSPVVQDLSSKLAETKADLAQARVLYGNNHPNVRKIEGQVAELQKQLASQKKRIVSELRSRYSAALQRQRLLGGELKSTAQELNTMARYNALKKDAQTQTEIYNSLYARVKEAGISAAAKSNNIRIVDKARVLDTPTRPHRMLNLIAGLFAGLLGGVILAFVVETLDNRLHTADDIVKATGFSSISILPVIGDSGLITSGRKLKLLRNKNGDNSHRLIIDRPASAEAEAMRGLYTNIMLSRRAAPPKVIVVVSAFPREGKTTVASNLAIILAQRCPTCLVDADLRKTGLAGVFELQRKPGFAEVLSGTTTLADALVALPEVPRLNIIPSGECAQNPADLMAGDVVLNSIQSLRTQFEFVVIDCPPVLPYADGRVLSTMADGVVLVGRSGITTRDAIVRTIDLLTEIQAAPIIDVVLNAADSSTRDYQYYTAKYANR